MALQIRDSRQMNDAASGAARPSIPELERAIASGWNPVCHITYTRDTWVKLLHSPSDVAFDEAMLLCQESPDTWVTWVPEHGEAVLDRSHFYFVE